MEARYLTQSTIYPHWNPDSTSNSLWFWYTRVSASLSSPKTEFIFADTNPVDGIPPRRPAFNHAALARELSARVGWEVNPDELPFDWIEPSPGNGTGTETGTGTGTETGTGAVDVKFRHQGKVFRFAADTEKLEEWTGEFGKVLHPVWEGSTSGPGVVKAGMVVKNRTREVVEVDWVDGKGERINYGRVEGGGGQVDFRSFVGHVWRITGKGGRSEAYRVEEGECTIIIEGPGWDAVATEEETRDIALRGGEEEEDKPEINKTQGFTTLFIRDNNVWVRDDGGEHQITSNNSSEFLYDHTSTIAYSSDGNFAVVWEYSPEQGYTLTLVESTPADQLQPKVRTQTYLKPGDKMRVDRPRMFDLRAKQEVSTDNSLFANPYSLTDLGWSGDSAEYRFIYNERGQKHLRVIGMDRTGAVRAIVDESSDTFVNYFHKLNYRFSPNSSELLWASERDGWNHLYLYDVASGTVKHQVTQGEFVVRDVERVDWDTRQVWVQVYGVVPGQDPYYEHLACVSLDDSASFTLLTEGDGTHTWMWSPDHRFLLDTYSRVDQLPVTTLRSGSTGALLAELETDDTPSLLAEGWTPPEIFVAPGRDGSTLIYGIIIRPTTPNFDLSSPHPIIEDIYASPHNYFTPKSFNPDAYSGMRDLANSSSPSGGYVMVKLDGMGTNWRHKAFHDTCHQNLADAGIPDRIAWIRAAAATRPWMDLNRVGIYGSSAGGQSAAAAVIFQQGRDFYKAAYADCGCHDNRLDKIWWNEQWMGWPVDEAKYAASSNVVNAAGLKGHLMLTVGEMDDNVDPASTLQLVKRLNEHGKDYEMMFFPGEGHGAGFGEVGLRRRLQFFQRHLG